MSFPEGGKTAIKGRREDSPRGGGEGVEKSLLSPSVLKEGEKTNSFRIEKEKEGPLWQDREEREPREPGTKEN